jgi:hypothetical protein
MAARKAKSKTQEKAKPKKPDWEVIERQYRANILSLRAIAAQFGISDTAIRKRAKAEGWQRDLADRVRKVAKEKLVRTDGSQSGSQSGSQQTSKSVSEKEITENAAELIVAVVRDHRSTLGSGRKIVSTLIAELQEASDNRAEIEESIEEETKGNENSKRRNSMLRAVSLPVRAGVMLNLSAAMKNVIAMERIAFSMDEQSGDGEASLEELLTLSYQMQAEAAAQRAA